MAALLACTRKGTPNLLTLWIDLFSVTAYHRKTALFQIKSTASNRKTAPFLLLLVDFICSPVHILTG